MLKSTRKALITSILSLVLCCTMLTGTTFAWFTDSVSSANNKIVAGDLDVDLLMYDGTKYGSIANKDSAIFGTKNGVNWEPGKTEVVYLAVKNEGTLDLKYNIILNVSGDLAPVLEYALLDGVEAPVANAPSTWTELKALTSQTAEVKVGKILAAPNGQLEAGETDFFALAVHMKENADSGFEEKSIKIDVNVIATQLASELDSFGKDYDEAAPLVSAWDGSADTEGFEAVTDTTAKTVKIKTSEQFKAFADSVNAGNTYAGYTVTLEQDIDLADKNWTPIGNVAWGGGFDGTFDGQGNTVKNLRVETVDAPAGLFGELKGVVKNLVITDAYVYGECVNSSVNAPAGIVAGLPYMSDATVENVTVLNSTVAGNNYVGGICGYLNGTVKGCKVSGVTAVGIQNATEEGKKVAGIAGYIDGGLVDGCSVSDSTLYANRDVAGIAGTVTANGTVTNNSVANVAVKYLTNGSTYSGYGDIVCQRIAYDVPASNVGTVNAEMVSGSNFAIDTDGKVTVVA